MSSSTAEGHSKRRQYIAAACATLATATAGMFIGWPSPSLPKLLEDGIVGSDDGSWIASVYMLSSTVSVLPAAYMADRLGRKLTLVMSCLPFASGWLLLMFAESAPTIYAARAVSGLGHGVVYTVCPMYLGEIASDEIRGALASMMTLMSKGGILFEYCVGPFVSMRTLSCINLLTPCLFVCTFPFQPESPYYHLKKGDRLSAERSLRGLLGTDRVERVLSRTEVLVREQMENEHGWSDLIRTRSNRRSLFILLVIYTTQQFCGSSAVIAYAQIIFSEASGSLGASESSILIGMVQLVVAFLSVFLVDSLGRKPLLVASTLGVLVTNVIMCAYFYLGVSHSGTVGSLGWLPLVTVSLFIVSYTVGLATVPFAITSEVFSVNIKSHATCVIQMFAGLATFAVVKLYQVVADTYGEHIIFMCFAIVSLLGFVFIIFKVPETKGKSFAEIYEQLKDNRTTDQR